MKRHIRIYMNAFEYAEDDRKPCEVGKYLTGTFSCEIDDIHHIEPKRMGGRKNVDMDVIENLIGVCRSHHDDCDSQRYDQLTQYIMHLSTLQDYGIPFSVENLKPIVKRGIYEQLAIVFPPDEEEINDLRFLEDPKF